MNRYINADALERALMFSEEVYNAVNEDGLYEVITKIDEVPSIDIVHCEECIHKEYCEHEVLLSTMFNEVEESAEITYCSYGERSE